ncbi:TPA: hypothetical protein ACJL7A_000060 [Neisseria meningitidis]|uniref:hypothetical protein n=1 Tax=Neisseria meningitidis TaxID=487 RepID=UPI0003A27447|nr:hypothetical protein [Neisseria meningitidis]MBH5558062.1 hypothetical protein [Neisseria meningitidis]MBH6216408.1 hypothetical protein [Neisseria meningitidis]MBH6231752.1 hypothetical protein [Neisseria meningitidis]MBW3891428.1 hypothetical protein [Neisseria meningitidis]MCL5714135.1 hypothetical protein [Neisseria meningitidis]
MGLRQCGNAAAVMYYPYTADIAALPYFYPNWPSLGFRRHIRQFPAGLPAVILPRQLVYGID